VIFVVAVDGQALLHMSLIFAAFCECYYNLLYYYQSIFIGNQDVNNGWLYRLVLPCLHESTVSK